MHGAGRSCLLGRGAARIPRLRLEAAHPLDRAKGRESDRVETWADLRSNLLQVAAHLAVGIRGSCC